MPATDLYVYPKKGDSRVIPLGKKRLTFGRPPSCDVSLSDQFASGCHVAIFPKGSKYVLLDQASKNGTFIDNRRVSGEVDLNRGDEIVVGETKIVVDRESQTSVRIVVYHLHQRLEHHHPGQGYHPEAALGDHPQGRRGSPGGRPARPGPEVRRRPERGQPGPHLPCC